MPEPADAECRYIWKQFEYEWIRVQDHWHDRVTDHFFARYLEPMRRETESLLHELQELTEVLDQAQAEARYRW